MSETIDPRTVADLAALAERCQHDPHRYCAYTGDDATTIAADLDEQLSAGSHLVIERDGTRLLGWLLAEQDTEVDRTWWWGPFVDSTANWAEIADRMYRTAQGSVPLMTRSEELAADSRSPLFEAFAARHDFVAEEGSACLRLDPPTDPPAVAPSPARSAGSVSVVALAAEHTDAVADLHDRLFPGSHTTGRALTDPVPATESAPRLVAVLDGRTVGYVATEHQNDGSLYIDFVGVEPDVAGRGIGRRLVAEACASGFERGASFAHLTVRASNEAARALYRSLGFVHERVLLPYRRGADAVSLGSVDVDGAA